MFDILIRNGTVIDGSGAPRFAGDVAIQGDRIVEVGALPEASATTIIDATGLVIAPGFVDVHNHSDGWLLNTPHLEAKTRQGFTTEVLMADGISYAPVNTQTAHEWLYYLRSLNGLRLDEYTGWSSIAEYMQQLEGRNVQNAMAHIPYANVRTLACGFGRQAVDDFQMRQIKASIRAGMEEGAVGVSTGLDYIAECFSPTDELVDACSAMAEYNGLYVTHIRYKTGLLPALKEAVEIGRRAGVRVHISHLKGQSPGEVEQVLEYIDNVARHEVDFSFDVYPYQPGSTMLNFLLPYEAWEDGPLAAMGRLREPHIRAKFAAGLRAYRLDLDHIRIAWTATKDGARWQGKLLSEYVDASGLPPEEALYNFLVEERLAVLLVFDEGEDRLVYPLLQHDLFMIGTDGIYFPEGPVHPRMYGSTGRILGPMVRDERLFSLEQAVQKLSSLPAARFGLAERGFIRTNHFADVVIFDPAKITDHATFDDPHQFTTGIHDVLVNGTPIISRQAVNENLPEQLPGRFLKYTPTAKP